MLEQQDRQAQLVAEQSAPPHQIAMLHPDQDE